MQVPNEPSIKQTLEILRQILYIDQSVSGLDYLTEIVKNIATALDVKYVFVGHANPEAPDTIQTDAVWGNHYYLDNFSYQLASTPCEIVMSGDRVCVHDKNVTEKFPDDTLLKDMGIESYAGTPLLGQKGDLLGLLVVLDDKPMNQKGFMIEIIDFLAQRISTEYDRYNIQQHLQQIIDEQTEQLQSANQHLHKTIKDLEQSRLELEQKSRLDPLTHINNRDWFTSLAQSQLNIARRNDYPISLLFIDLDHFKQVNDNYGHVIGDHVLEEAAQRIKRCIRDIDILGRFGGEEFILLAPYSNKDAAIHLATRIKNAISDTAIHTDKQNIYITTSIGIYVSEHSDDDLKDLLDKADNALYQAKENGRDQYIFY